MSLNSILKQSADYHIGIITALPVERAAFTLMLDARHGEPCDFSRSRNDSNAYTWGNIGSHNLVITSLAAGAYGTTMATNTAMPMTNTFPSIKFGIMIGIGAGIPSQQHDIRLGDVVVSQPSGSCGGVFQYDLGKAVNGEWERKDFQARPPDALLHAVAHLQSEHKISKPRAPSYLTKALHRGEDFAAGFSRPQYADDCLFQPHYCHQQNISSNTCFGCDPSYLIPRPSRSSTDFKIHYGLIASGNTLVKDAILRDRIASYSEQCICIEMEAAGLINNFPCIVIRGICDYADTHKNDVWQSYASATAAAFAKELLQYIPRIETYTNPSISGISRGSHRSVLDLRRHDETVELLDFKAFMLEAQSRRNDPLLTALKQRRTDIAAKIVADNKNINMKLPAGKCTMLFSAAKYGNAKIVGQLIRRGADVNDGHEDKASPLHAAVANGHYEIIELLIKHQADIEYRDEYGSTPLFVAIHENELKAAELLLDYGADVNAQYLDCWTPLHVASGDDNVRMVKLLLQRGAKVDARTPRGSTPLHRATSNNHPLVVEILLEHGAYIEGKDRQGWTPLHDASYNGHFDLVQLLLTKGADVEAKTIVKTKPLQLAACEGHSKIVEALLKAGADVDGRDEVRRTALHYAAEGNWIEAAKVLLDAKAEVDAHTWQSGSSHRQTDGAGSTPLVVAIRKGHLEMTQLLLEYGASPTRHTRHGRPMDLAVESGHPEIKSLIRRHGGSTIGTRLRGIVRYWNATDSR